MKKKLYKIHVKTFAFSNGVVYYDLFVLADDLGEALTIVSNDTRYKDDKFAEIERYDEVPTEVSRVVS